MTFLSMILGLCVGSFLNVLVYRLPQDMSVNFPASHCPTCGQRLKPQHLVPVISFLFLHGKCAFCGEKISWRYPMVELLNGLLYGIIAAYYGTGALGILLMLSASCLLAIALMDLDTLEVHTIMLAAGYVLAVLVIMVRGYAGESVWGYMYTGFLGMGLIMLIIRLSRGGMGSGDIHILGIIGFLLGPGLTALSFFLTSILGGVYALTVLSLGQRKGSDAVPFGPFLVGGFLLSLCFGGTILEIYSRLLF